MSDELDELGMQLAHTERSRRGTCRKSVLMGAPSVDEGFCPLPVEPPRASRAGEVFVVQLKLLEWLLAAGDAFVQENVPMAPNAPRNPLPAS